MKISDNCHAPYPSVGNFFTTRLSTCPIAQENRCPAWLRLIAGITRGHAWCGGRVHALARSTPG